MKHLSQKTRLQDKKKVGTIMTDSKFEIVKRSYFSCYKNGLILLSVKVKNV